MKTPSPLYVLAAGAALTTALAGPATAATATGYLDQLRTEAAAAGAFNGFSAERGRSFFTVPHGNEWSCATCHGERPAVTGKHARTGKEIAPLAPAANPERFADQARTEKWFRRNCNDVLGRACTPLEKGDVLTWLMSLKP
jgi:hypothetical protein